MFRAWLILNVHILTACFASQKLILKIEYNARTDKQTSLNELNITLVNETSADNTSYFKENKVQTNEINSFNQDNNMNSTYDTLKHPSPQDDSFSKVRAERNANYMDFTYIIPFVQDKGDTERIKDKLKNFAMYRKKTYVPTPKFDFPISKIAKTDLHNKENEFNRRNNINSRRYQHEDIDNSDGETIKHQNSKILDILNKQNTLIERVANRLLKDKRRKENVARTQFNDIVASLEARQNRTTSVKTTSTTRELSAIMTLIDETEIRKALKKDPFVRRILQMANKKRLDYEKQLG